eukprot:5878247-Pyramimonas_sp.AAC.2
MMCAQQADSAVPEESNESQEGGLRSPHYGEGHAVSHSRDERVVQINATVRISSMKASPDLLVKWGPDTQRSAPLFDCTHRR